MKFGLFFELSVPRPLTPAADRRMYELALEQVKLADELGFDQMWTVEHHFLEEYSHSSAPELWLTSVACHTKNIRIGHGICTLLPAYNHPIRSAERAAWLDIISNGRLEFGTGRSTTWTELGGFGVDPDKTKEMWDDSLRAIPKMWMQDEFSWDSEFLKCPPRAIVPEADAAAPPARCGWRCRPRRRPPRPPSGASGCWACRSAPRPSRKPGSREYRRVIQNCDPVGAFVNEQANNLNWLYVDEDRERGHRMGERLIASFNELATKTVGINQVYPAHAYNTPGLLFALRRDSMAGAKALIKDGFCIGTPDDVIASLKRWESIGCDGIMFLVNSKQTIPQEQVLNSLRLFAKEVMPKFKDPAPVDVRRPGVVTTTNLNGNSTKVVADA